MSWWQGDLPTRIGLPGWTQSLAAPSDDQHAGLIMKASPFHDPGPKPTKCEYSKIRCECGVSRGCRVLCAGRGLGGRGGDGDAGGGGLAQELAGGFDGGADGVGGVAEQVGQCVDGQAEAVAHDGGRQRGGEGEAGGAGGAGGPAAGAAAG